MKKAFLAVAAAATIAAGAMTVSTPANARCTGCWIGGAIVGGAILGSAIAHAYPRGGYVVYEDYDEPYPYRCRHGYWARQRLYNGDGDFVGWSKPKFFCR